MYKELRTLYVEYIYFVCIWYWVPHIGTMKYAYSIQIGNAEREGSAIVYTILKKICTAAYCTLFMYANSTL